MSDRLEETTQAKDQLEAHWETSSNLILHLWVCEESVDRDVNQFSEVGCHSHAYPRCVAWGHVMDVLVMFVHDMFSMAICPFQTPFTYFQDKTLLFLLCQYGGVRSGHQNHVYTSQS